jgi:hypothetical protein
MVKKFLVGQKIERIREYVAVVNNELGWGMIRHSQKIKIGRAIAVTQDVVHPGLRATAYSLCVIIMHLLGSALGPLVVGLLSNRWGITPALTLLPLSALRAGILFFIGSFYSGKDLVRMERVVRW